MFRTIKSNGILSYAGLDLKKVCLQMKLLYENVPNEMHGFIPIFPAELIENMPYVGQLGRCSTPSGFAADPLIYHSMLFREYPDLYMGRNQIRCLRNNRIISGEIYIDEAWCERFPQYRPYFGDLLYIRLIGGGHQAVAMPRSLYPFEAELVLRAEEITGIRDAAQRSASFLREKIRTGNRHDLAQLEFEYLSEQRLTAPWMTQAELSLLLSQAVLQTGKKCPPQKTVPRKMDFYAPAQLDSLCFTGAKLSPHSGHFAQLYDVGDDYFSNYWIPWNPPADAGVISVEEFCRGRYQPLKPKRDGGAAYSCSLRVVSLRRKIRVQKAVMEDQTEIYCIPNSRALIDKGAMHCENLGLLMTHTDLSEQEWLNQREASLFRFELGQLEEALWRRNELLRQCKDSSLEDTASRLMWENRRILQLEKSLDGEEYSSDKVNYLKRKYLSILRNDPEEGTEEGQELESEIQADLQMRTLPEYSWEELWKEDEQKPRRKRVRPRGSGSISTQLLFR